MWLISIPILTVLSLLFSSFPVWGGVIECPTKLDYELSLTLLPKERWKGEPVDRKSWIGIENLLSASIDKNRLICSYLVEGQTIKLTRHVLPGTKCRIENNGRLKSFVCF